MSSFFSNMYFGLPFFSLWFMYFFIAVNIWWVDYGIYCYDSVSGDHYFSVSGLVSHLSLDS